MNPSLIDTDVLSEILKQKDAVIVERASEYLKEHQRFAISSITRYEVLRGLKEKNATAQLQKFEPFCRHSIVFAVTDEILDLAAGLWVAGRRDGRPSRDADLMIAATALLHGYTLVPGNTKHFDWIRDLTVANWLET